MRAREFKASDKKLVIFDIDDTLLHTTAKINVVKDGKVKRSLSNQEFNNYKLQPGEEFDFGEFRNAKKFEEESVPIGPMLDKLRQDLAAGHDVVMLTARSDFDNQPAVWRTFKRHGIDINKDVHLYRAGNLPGSDSPAHKKAVHVTKWLKTGKYNHVIMYDDSEKNLFVFKGLNKLFPNVDFEAHHVNDEGETRQVEEGKGHKKDVFIDMFKKFLPLAMKVIGLDNLPRMVFLTSIRDEDQPTFGRYVNDEKTLYVALANRHPNDILRTIAHELTHYKQDTEHQLHNGSGETGSEHENQANALAGVVMRHFNKNYPEYLKVKPVVLEGWSDKYKRSINCSNPRGFSQRAHCQGRKKNEAVEPHEPGYQHDILTMPANTLVIDTPGELDWYKIGQHFPNLGKEDPHEYGQSESDMVINFANPEEMMKFAQVAKRLGLKIKSIGGSPEHPEIHAEKPSENFADGRNPQDKGDSKRYNVPTKGKISTLRKIAKQGGRRGQLAHWMANMRSGKAKKK